jgi:hypothetical protein
MSSYNTTLDDIHKSVSTIIDILVNNNDNQNTVKSTDNFYIEHDLKAKMHFQRGQTSIDYAKTCSKFADLSLTKTEKIQWIDKAFIISRDASISFQLAFDFTNDPNLKKEYLNKALNAYAYGIIIMDYN